MVAVDVHKSALADLGDYQYRELGHNFAHKLVPISAQGSLPIEAASTVYDIVAFNP